MLFQLSNRTYLMLLLLVAALSALVGLVFAGPAVRAHSTGAANYTHEWSMNEPDLSMTRGNMGGMSNSKIPSRMQNAANQWNNAPNTHGADAPPITVDSTVHSQPHQIYSVCSLPLDHEIWLFTGPRPLGALVAETVECRVFGTIVLSNVNFNGNLNWGYNLKSVASNQYHFASALTHEVGHALGFEGHWSAGLTRCTTSPRETMCNHEPLGTIWMRNLEEHDEHAYDAAYQ